MGMPMDVWQSEDGYHVALDLPGVDPDTVEITAEESVLTIRAERGPEYEQGQNVLVAERPQGSFTRQVQVGQALDLENVQAQYSNGVLHLVIPLAQAAQPRRIQVQSGDAGGGNVNVTASETDPADTPPSTVEQRAVYDVKAGEPHRHVQ